MIQSILVAGRGTTGIRRLRDEASNVRPDDVELVEAARKRGLFKALRQAGVATIDDEIIGDGWLLYTSNIDEDDLDCDPAVLAYTVVREEAT